MLEKALNVMLWPGFRFVIVNTCTIEFAPGTNDPRATPEADPLASEAVPVESDEPPADAVCKTVVPEEGPVLVAV